MKRILFPALCLALLLAVLLLSACSGGDAQQAETEAPEETPEPLTVVFEKKYGSGLLMEPMSGKVLFVGEYASASVNGRTYDFERIIAEDERLALIGAEEELLRLLACEEPLTVRVLTDYPCFSDSEAQTVYLGADACRSWRQILATLSAIEGDYVNYGYLYAKADRLAAALGWTRDDQAKADDSLFAVDRALLNLNYLCFDETYTHPRRIAACKALALSLGGETEEEFLAAAEAWAEEHGIDYTPCAVRFAPFGRGCPLKMRTKDLEIFRKADFKGDYLVLHGYTREDPFDDADSLMTVLTALDEKTGDLRRRFGVEEAPVVSVLLTDGVYASENVLSLARVRLERGSYTIDASSLLTLSRHGYATLLFTLRGGGTDPAAEGWMAAAAVSYLDFDDFLTFYKMETRRENPDYLPVIEEILGKPLESPADFARFERYAFQYFGVSVDKKTLPDYPELMPVFGYWFSRTYGEDLFLDCMLAPSEIPERTGRTLYELVEDFDAWLREPPDESPTSL